MLTFQAATNTYVSPLSYPNTHKMAHHVPLCVVDTQVAPGMGFRPHVLAELTAWDIGLRELVRHTFLQCEERGVLLNRARHRLYVILGSVDMWQRRLTTRLFDLQVRATTYTLQVASSHTPLPLPTAKVGR